MVGTVHVEVLSAFAEVVGMPGRSEEVLPEHDGGGDRSVRAFIARLTAKYQYFGDIVFDSNVQKLTGRVMIFYNGRDLELSDGLETKLSDGDSLTFVPVIPGG